jgi:hypothetical protein
MFIQDEPVAKKKIRAAGFKKLGSLSFRKKEYVYAAGCYSLVLEHHISQKKKKCSFFYMNIELEASKISNFIFDFGKIIT